MLLNISVSGQAVIPDTEFGNAGKVILSPGTLHDVANALAIQSDQKIVFTGVARITPSAGFATDLVVGRLNANGTPDVTFGVNGIYSLASSAGSVIGNDVKIQPDGKIVVCGGYAATAGNTEFIAIRLNSNGTPDLSFGGGDGISIIPVSTSEDYAYELEFSPDGGILLAGSSNVPGFVYKRGIIMKLLPDGTLNTAFGTGGITVVKLFPSSAETFRCLEVLQSGKIIAAGSSTFDTSEYLFLAGLKPDGKPDSTFATNGVLSTPGFNQAFDMASDGKSVFLAGRVASATGFDLGICCYDTSGVLVDAFGQNGRVVADYNPFDAGLAITLQPDGKIVCAGTSGLGVFGNRDMIFTRYFPGGTLDSTFNSTGYVIIPVSGSFEEANGVALQQDGKIVAAGFASFTNNDMVILRLTTEASTGVETPAGFPGAISVFPVPLSGSGFSIQTGRVTGHPVKCELYDQLGRQIAGQTRTASDSRVDFSIPSSLPNGIYSLRVRLNGKDYFRTLVK